MWQLDRMIALFRAQRYSFLANHTNKNHYFFSLLGFLLQNNELSLSKRKKY